MKFHKNLCVFTKTGNRIKSRIQRALHLVVNEKKKKRERERAKPGKRRPGYVVAKSPSFAKPIAVKVHKGLDRP